MLDPQISPVVLLSHTGWVRDLAQRLVREATQADDLAQDALLRALERPPSRGESPRGWLAVVLRNLARQATRSDRRRSDRELRVAQPEGAGIVERTDLH